MKTHHTLAVLALTACTLPAVAASESPETWPWGTHPELAEETVPFYGEPGVVHAFERYALFTVDGPSELLAHVETSGVTGFNVSAGMLTLWRSNGDADFGNDELIGGFDFFAAPVQQTFAGLGGGEYFYLLEGVATGYGTVRFTSSVSAVPEPGAWALMLAGTGLLGPLTRRRLAV